MRIILALSACLITISYLYAQSQTATPMPPFPGSKLTESEYSYKIYSDDKGDNRHEPFEGGEEKTVLLKTLYKFDDHCYVSCQSEELDNPAYRNRDGSLVHGMYSVRGNYLGGHCRPVGYQALDYSYLRQFIKLCKREFPACRNRCRAGSYTGFLFGIHTE